MKHPDMEKWLDELTQTLFGRSRTGSISSQVCVFCNQPAVEFEDELSRREYGISGMCQACQNAIFKEDEEDEEDLEMGGDEDGDEDED